MTILILPIRQKLHVDVSYRRFVILERKRKEFQSTNTFRHSTFPLMTRSERIYDIQVHIYRIIPQR
jgi:hypothetical protein